MRRSARGKRREFMNIPERYGRFCRNMGGGSSPAEWAARPFSDKTTRPSAQGGGALSDGQRPRYNLHSSQVGCLQLTLLLPTSGRMQQRGGLQTIR